MNTISQRAHTALKETLSSVHGLEHISEDPSFLSAVAMLQDRKRNIIITGIGKSGYIGMKIAASMTSLGHPAIFLHPIEAMHGDLGIIQDSDVIIALSFSGNSQEVVRIVRYAEKAFNVSTIAITGNVDSPLAQASDIAITFSTKHEGCPLGLAPMASTTTTLVIGDMLTASLVSPDDFKEEHFARFHPEGSLGLKTREVSEIMHTKDALPLVPQFATVPETLRTMSEKKFGVTGVVDNTDTLIGIITDGDVRRFFTQNPDASKKIAADMMTQEPKVLKEHDSLKHALEIMEDKKITTMFIVTTDRNPLGIVHMHMILEHFLQ
jgi:arabinose-5-phosphate isomerase